MLTGAAQRVVDACREAAAKPKGKGDLLQLADAAECTYQYKPIRHYFRTSQALLNATERADTNAIGCIVRLAITIEQDLEPEPNGGGHRLRHGVARDRRISATDPEMRHGRKSKSRVSP